MPPILSKIGLDYSCNPLSLSIGISLLYATLTYPSIRFEFVKAKDEKQLLMVDHVSIDCNESYFSKEFCPFQKYNTFLVGIISYFSH